MAEKLVTPEFRAAFVSVVRATASRVSPDNKKYGIKAVFSPTTDITALKKAAEEAVKEKWPNGAPKGLRSPFRTNDELENPVVGVEDDAMVITFSSPENRRPGLVDRNLQDIIDETEVYAGCFLRAQVRPYAYDKAGNKGVAFGLENVMKTRDGDPLGSGRMPASKAFEGFGGKSGGGGVFD